MDRNPYSPPEAPVEDRAPEQPPRERPKQILWASWLLWSSMFWGLASLVFSEEIGIAVEVLEGEAFRGVRLLLLLVLVGSFTIYLWLIDRMRAGKNWARILLLVFLVAGLAGELTPGDYEATAAYIGTRLVDIVLQVSAMMLMFTKPGSEWFRPRT